MQASFCDHCGDLSLTKIRVGRITSGETTFDVCSKCERSFMKLTADFIKYHTPRDLAKVQTLVSTDLDLDELRKKYAISPRAYNCLVAANLRSLSSICALRREDLYRLDNCGRKTVFEIESVVKKEGRQLSQ